MTEKIRLALVGFGNVGKAFARLLLQKQEQLQQEFDLQCLVTGICTGSHGSVINPQGLDLEQALARLEKNGSLTGLSSSDFAGSALDFVQACPGDVLVETTPVDPRMGQPALGHIQAGLQKGMHVITANKGPVVYGYQSLTQLAHSQGKRFLFEAAVMDGAPIFSLFRQPLAGAKLLGFSGVLNSCTNLLLERMEGGETLEQAIVYGASIGITETDPSNDVDGWDAAIKVAALSTVLMNHPLTPLEVQPTGIRGITPGMIAEARQAGEKWKLVCSAGWDVEGQFFARVHPERVGPASPLYQVSGTSSFVLFQLDVLPGLGIFESNPNPQTTAFGLLSDLLYAVRGK
ncbi:MAG: homoserine dehydrogenase [Anaerolineaceae bacterium]